MLKDGSDYLFALNGSNQELLQAAKVLGLNAKNLAYAQL